MVDKVDEMSVNGVADRAMPPSACVHQLWINPATTSPAASNMRELVRLFAHHTFGHLLPLPRLLQGQPNPELAGHSHPFLYPHQASSLYPSTQTQPIRCPFQGLHSSPPPKVAVAAAALILASAGISAVAGACFMMRMDGHMWAMVRVARRCREPIVTIRAWGPMARARHYHKTQIST
ncbi:hypothetical protein BJ912DRAFT_1063674 [Pholiota molesta]|nr:hypothetical protein BJ912DRAFT_1063674 [Pholiota molesta]